MLVGDLPVRVERKAIKNLHIAVEPPEGGVRVAAPHHMSTEAIRVAISRRLGWIRRQQDRFRRQERQTEREMVSGETHYLFGRGYRLLVERRGEICRIRLEGDRMRLVCPADADRNARFAILERWYRRALRDRTGPRIAQWSARLDLPAPDWGIRRMKTKWGACNPDAPRIWLNLELAKKPLTCLDYVVVHELAHLVSPHHDARFISVLDRALPTWRSVRQALNEAPLAAEAW